MASKKYDNLIETTTYQGVFVMECYLLNTHQPLGHAPCDLVSSDQPIDYLPIIVNASNQLSTSVLVIMTILASAMLVREVRLLVGAFKG
jgi:hypothetical protein